MTEHRVRLGQRFDLVLDRFIGNVQVGGQLFLFLLEVGHELVQRRIEQANRHGQAVHRFEQALEVAPLDREQLGERLAASGLVVGEDHLADGLDAVAFEEHVLGTAQPDTLRSETEGRFRVARRVGVSADLQVCVLVGQFHQLGEVAAHFGVLRGHLALVDDARRAVERNPVAFLVGLVAYGDRAGLVVDLQVAGARYAAFAHAAGYDGCVRGHASARGQDTVGRVHALEVFGRGFDADEDRLLALGGPFFGLVGEKDDLARSGSRGSGQTLGDDVGLFDRVLVEYRVQQLVELLGLYAQYGGRSVDHALTEHLHRDADHCGAGTLAVTRLEHPQLAVLDRELEVLHILEVIFEMLLDFVQLLVGGRHHLFERRVLERPFALGNALQFGPAARALDGDLLRRADTGYHVFSLSVDEVFAVENVFARSGVAREGHARSRRLAHVTEHHRLYVHGRSPFGGDVVQLAVQDGALVHPAAEYGADSAPELFPRIGREVLARVFLDRGLEAYDQFLQVVGRQLGIVLDFLLFLDRVDDLLERIDVLLALRLHVQHDVPVHLHETAVRVPCEARVAGFLGQSFDGLVVQSEVQDRVHHARHRRAGSRADRQKKRVAAAAKLHAHVLLDAFHGGLDLGLDHLDDLFLAVLIIFGADFGGDRKSRRNRYSHQVHFREVGSLSAEQLPHLSVTFRLLVAEGIDSFNVWHLFLN